MKKLIPIAFFLGSLASVNIYGQQDIIAELKTRMPDSERTSYLGTYLITQDDKESKREIIIINDIFFYVTGENERIPLKVIDKKDFQLYPSGTHIHFEFDDTGAVRNILITTGSGNKIKGVKLIN